MNIVGYAALGVPGLSNIIASSKKFTKGGNQQWYLFSPPPNVK